MTAFLENMTVCEQRRVKIPPHLNSTDTEISPGLLQAYFGGGGGGGFQAAAAREDSKIMEVNGTWIQESCHGETFPDIEIKPLRKNKIYIQVATVEAKKNYRRQFEN